MKTSKKLVSYGLVSVLSLSMVVSSPTIGSLGVDVVSAATTGATPAAPAQTTPKTQTASKPATGITRLLALGSYGNDVKTLQTALNSTGYILKADGIFGKATQAAVKAYQGKNGLKADGIVGPKTLAKLNPATLDVATSEKTTIKIGKADFAAHGTKSFTYAAVAMAGDKIIDAYIDEYQVMNKEGNTGVPNSDVDFGKNFQDGKVLGSKRLNAVAYSANMAKSAGSTVTLDKSWDAIQAYTKGKTVAELEKVLSGNTKEQMVDAVSGATLVDTYGYVSAIVEAAKDAQKNSAVEVDSALVDSIKVRKVDYAAHGTKSFAVAAVAMSGDKVIGVCLDEYQVMNKEGNTGVPNSDVDFGKNFQDGKVLASKRLNAAAYSANMAKSAGSTVTLNKSWEAIEKYATGKTVVELEKALSGNTKEQMVDAVSGATLVDTHGYVSAIVAAAKNTNGNGAIKTDTVTSTKTAIKLGKADFAAHGTKSFAYAAVVMSGDKIIHAYLDEYQVMNKEGNTGVPNSDVDFGKNFQDGKVLASKRENAVAYSANMAKSAGATVTLDKSWDAIQAYAKGKTVAELEKTLSGNTKEQMVDAVSGATLVDTHGYISAIVAAAKDAQKNSAVEIDTAALGSIKVGKVDFAAHGTKSFTVAVAVVSGDKVVGAHLDEYQVMNKEGNTGVPNSDVDFGKNFQDGKVLGSKRTNAVAYSANMAKSAGSTVAINKSLDAIQEYAIGKTIAVLEGTLSTTSKEQMVDTVSGATLVDTHGYITAIAKAAKAAK